MLLIEICCGQTIGSRQIRGGNSCMCQLPKHGMIRVKSLCLIVILGAIVWLGSTQTRGASIGDQTESDEPSVEALQEQIKQLQELVKTSLERQQTLERRLEELESSRESETESTTNLNPDVAPSTQESGMPPSPWVHAHHGLESSAASMPAPALNLPGSIQVGPGLKARSENDEFTVEFHTLTQVDGRFYEQGGQQFTRDIFGLPRQWFVFNGHITRPFEYYLALNQGFDNFALLDAYLNINYDERLQFRIGRYKTPFMYEFYNLPAGGLLTPERSQFFNNFALNRSVGVMALGNLFDGGASYAVGIHNGSSNAALDDNDAKNVTALVDVLPFKLLGSEKLANFHIGGSLDFGNQFSTQIPPVLQLNVPTAARAGATGVPFLTFEPGTLESGTRAYWSLHSALYYKQLSIYGEWLSGGSEIAPRDAPQARTRVPVDSFYVAVGYFLTGETVTDRGRVEPRRPFDPRRGRRGPGAWELAFRFDLLNLGDEIFTSGLADRSLWTNRVETIDLGMNWYLNQYVRIYTGWQHAVFGDPVLFDVNPDRLQLTSDLFWFRFQVYF